MVPVAPVAPIAAVSAAGSATDFPAESAPPALRALAPGTRFAAQVTETLAPDRARLATRFGPLVVRTSTPLPVGAAVVLSVQGRASDISFRLLDLRPGGDMATGTGGPLPASGGAVPAATLSAGAGIRATVVSAAPLNPAPGSGATVSAPIGQPGTTLTVRLWPAGTRPVAGPPGAVDAGPAPARPLSPPAAARSLLLSGVMSGARDGGRPVVRTPAGMLALDVRAAPPAGTPVDVEIVSAPRPPSDPQRAWPRPAADAPPWPADRIRAAAIEALAGGEPAFAGTLLRSPPSPPDSRLAVTLILALGLLRGGGPPAAAGEPLLPALARLPAAARARVAETAKDAVRAAEDPAGGTWRLLSLPVPVDGVLAPVRLAMRDPGGDEAGDGAVQAATRFLVDVALSRFGRLQLDGLVGDAGRSLELLVRSTTPLPAAVRDGIRSTFHDAGVRTGLKGTLGFRVEPGRLPDPWQAAASTAGPGIVI